MNSRISDTMFSTPVSVHVTGEPDSAGDRSISAPFTIFGYVYDETKVVTNELGQQEVSNRQIYLPRAAINRIKISDRISCLDNVQVRIIKRTGFRGKRNEMVIGVLYLP